MVSITTPLKPETIIGIEHFAWVNWSEVTREKLFKDKIFEEYIKTGKLSKEDQKFCDEIDWHPVDRLPLREEFVKELKRIEKEPAGKSRTPAEFNKWCDSL